MIREIAISLFNSHGGIEEGDVLECRAPTAGIGGLEAKGVLWFRADISEALAHALKSPLLDSNGIKLMKRRYSIPLEKIAEIDPAFDVVKARDLDNAYQPYLPLGEGMLFTDPDPDTFALETLSIVWDKDTGVYI